MTADTSSSRDRVTLSLTGVRIELTGAHAELIVRFVLGQLGKDYYAPILRNGDGR